MSAIELFHADGKTAGVWYCSECRVVHRTEPEAIACHGQLLCTTEGCGKEVSRYKRHIGKCDECDQKAWSERAAKEELARYEKAEKVPESEWDGPVYADGIGPEWFETLDDFREYYEDEDTQNLEYIWATKDVGVPSASVSDITEHLLENMWEDADESDLNGLVELDTAIREFNKANEGVRVYNVDYSKAIVLRPVVEAE